MSTACVSFGSKAHQLCGNTAGSCDKGTELIILALSPIMYSLFSLGGLYLVDGTIRLTDHAVQLLSSCCKRKIEEPVLPNVNGMQGEEEDPQPSCWERVKGIWGSLFKTGRRLSQATLCVSIALPLFFVTKYLHSGCESIRHGCPGFNASVTNGCYSVESFILNVINDAVEQQLGKIPNFTQVNVTIPTQPPSFHYP